jgi:hypothetical protein
MHRARTQTTWGTPFHRAVPPSRASSWPGCGAWHGLPQTLSLFFRTPCSDSEPLAAQRVPLLLQDANDTQMGPYSCTAERYLLSASVDQGEGVAHGLAFGASKVSLLKRSRMCCHRFALAWVCVLFVWTRLVTDNQPMIDCASSIPLDDVQYSHLLGPNRYAALRAIGGGEPRSQSNGRIGDMDAGHWIAVASMASRTSALRTAVSAATETSQEERTWQGRGLEKK